MTTVITIDRGSIAKLPCHFNTNQRRFVLMASARHYNLYEKEEADKLWLVESWSKRKNFDHMVGEAVAIILRLTQSAPTEI